jgi:hypothetical protein
MLRTVGFDGLVLVSCIHPFLNRSNNSKVGMIGNETEMTARTRFITGVNGGFGLHKTEQL